MYELFFSNPECQYTRTELNIINYILEHPESCTYMSIGALARKTGSSEPTLSRLARHCGYADFKELRAAMAAHLGDTRSPADKLTSSMAHPDTSTPEGMLRYQQYCIEKTLSFLSISHIQKAADAIVSARRIYLCAKGASLSIAQLLRFRLSRFGLSVSILPPGGSELFEEMNFFTCDDLIILFSFQKTTREAAVLLDYQKQVSYQVIFLTSRLPGPDMHSNLSHGIIPLYLYRGEPTEYHSMAAPCALIDALVLLTGQKMGDAPKESLSRLYHLKEHYKTQIPR